MTVLLDLFHGIILDQSYVLQVKSKQRIKQSLHSQKEAEIYMLLAVIDGQYEKIKKGKIKPA